MHVLYDHRPGPYRLPYTQGTLYAISADAGAPGCLACARAADLGGGGREGAVVLEDGALRAGEAGEDARRAAHDADGGCRL